MNSTIEEDSDPADGLRPRRPPAGWLFRLVVPVTFLFVFTCFVIITHDLLGDQNTRFAGFLCDYGTKILGWEAALAIAMAIIAMAADRLKTLRSGGDSAASPEASRPAGMTGSDSTSLSEDTDGQSES